MVTRVPATPAVGDTLLILGGGTTVNVGPLLLFPPTVTTTLPVVVPLGTVIQTWFVLHKLICGVAPLMVTVLDPCVAPNPPPSIATMDPMAPLLG
jgi:hypothetical protein